MSRIGSSHGVGMRQSARSLWMCHVCVRGVNTAGASVQRFGLGGDLRRYSTFGVARVDVTFVGVAHSVVA